METFNVSLLHLFCFSLSIMILRFSILLHVSGHLEQVVTWWWDASLLLVCAAPRCDIDKSHILRSGHWTRSWGFNINRGSVQIDILTPIIPMFHSTHIHYPSPYLLLWVSWKHTETRVKKHGLSISELWDLFNWSQLIPIGWSTDFF